MTQSLTLVIPGTPVGKGRPRFSTSGRFPRAYTPEKTAAYEELVRTVWAKSGRKTAPSGAAIHAVIMAGFPIPKSKSKKARAAMAAGQVPYLSKPDCDNVAKAALDALNGLAYHDDSQIVSLSVTKCYVAEPHCTIHLRWEEADV